MADVRVSFVQLHTVYTGVNIGWSQFDPLGAIKDVRVAWAQFDPLAAAKDVLVSWVQFDPLAGGIMDYVVRARRRGLR